MKMIPLSDSNEELIEEYEDYRDEEINAMRRLARQLKSIRTSMRELQRQYRTFLYQNLQDAYQVYIAALRSPHAERFFSEIRSELVLADIKINKNTNDAALLVRFISAEEVTPKTVYDWSSALILASENGIRASEFAEWLKSKTITGAVKERRALEKNDDEKKERMHRARRIILRALEARETKPLATFTAPAQQIERGYVSLTGLVMALGTASRRMGRASFYADINLSYVLPPDKKLELLILDRLAKRVVDEVEYYEDLFDKRDEREWGEHVWERLVAVEEETATQKQIP